MYRPSPSHVNSAAIITRNSNSFMIIHNHRRINSPIVLNIVMPLNAASGKFYFSPNQIFIFASIAAINNGKYFFITYASSSKGNLSVTLNL